MSEWPMVKLGEVADFINGAAFKPSDWSSEGRPIIRIQNLTNPNSPFNRTERKVKDLLYVDPGDLLVSWSATLGVFRWTGQERAVLNQHIFKVVPKSIDNAYLEFGLRFALQQIEKYLHGATMRHINRKEFLNLTVPLPPLGEQKRIAEILDKINSSIESTTNELYILNNLARFSFIKNCGNPNTFFGQIELKKIATIVTGNTPPRKEKGYYGNHIEWIKSDNLGGTFPSPASESLSQEGMKKGRIADPGSLLMTCIAGSIKSIGKISIVNRKVAFNQQINSIKPHNSDDLHFLYLLFQIAPELVQRRSTGGLKGIVKKSSLESCKIPWPDKQTRKKMGTFCKEWIDLQTLLYKKLTLLRELQRSLSARAFTGEL